jgi:hypothetical protein
MTFKTTSKSLGTKTTTKVTDKTEDNQKTGHGTMREVEQYICHPNLFKNLPAGYAIVSIPHRDGVKRMKVHLVPRENLPLTPLPRIAKIRAARSQQASIGCVLKSPSSPDPFYLDSLVKFLFKIEYKFLAAWHFDRSR